MQKKKKAKAKVHAKSRALSLKVKKEEAELISMHAGASKLLGKPKNEQEAKEQQLLKMFAKALDLPIIGVNVSFGLPYINHVGLTYELGKMEKVESAAPLLEHCQFAKTNGDKAIIVYKVTLKDGRSATAIGEADDKSIKLAAVKLTPNMMAETRAYNRAIRSLIGHRLIEKLQISLGKMSKVSEEDKTALTGALQTSSEEIDHTNKNTYISTDDVEDTTPIMKNSDMLQLKEALAMVTKVENSGIDNRAKMYSLLITKLTILKKSWNQEQINYMASIIKDLKNRYAL